MVSKQNFFRDYKFQFIFPHLFAHINIFYFLTPKPVYLIFKFKKPISRLTTQPFSHSTKYNL